MSVATLTALTGRMRDRIVARTGCSPWAAACLVTAVVISGIEVAAGVLIVGIAWVVTR